MRVLILFYILLLTGGLYSCVSSSKYTALKQENAELIAMQSLPSAKQEVEQAKQQEIADLKIQLRKTEDALTTFYSSYANGKNPQAEADSLKYNIATLESEIRSLRQTQAKINDTPLSKSSDIDKLRSELKTIKAAHDGLKASNKIIQADLASCQKNLEDQKRKAPPTEIKPTSVKNASLEQRIEYQSLQATQFHLIKEIAWLTAKSSNRDSLKNVNSSHFILPHVDQKELAQRLENLQVKYPDANLDISFQASTASIFIPGSFLFNPQNNFLTKEGNLMLLECIQSINSLLQTIHIHYFDHSVTEDKFVSVADMYLKQIKQSCELQGISLDKISTSSTHFQYRNLTDSKYYGIVIVIQQ